MLRRRKPKTRAASRGATPDLIARLGHELRTPLNAILGFSELTLRESFGPVGNPRYVEYARFIHEGARRLLAAVDALHALARHDQGRVRAARRPLRLAEVARAAVDAAAARAAQRGIALTAGRLDGEALVSGDGDLLLALAAELVANAIAFTPAGGRIEVAVSTRKRGGALAVRDSGVGIPAGKRRAVFEPFVRLHQAGVEGGGGPGLGLALAARIAALHDGRIALAAAPGGGTVATLILPPAKTKPRGRRAL
jgi:signal transduction histidine kinase